MAMEPSDIQRCIERYRAAPTDATLSELVNRDGFKESTVIWHLKRAGIYGAAPAPERFETDAELGIGEEDAPAPLDIAGLMEHPQFAKLIDAAVVARMGNVGSPMTQNADFEAFTATLKHLIEVQAMQQPGYIKPISAEEMDRRADGYVQMKALLKRFELERRPPLYLLTEMFFECTNAVQYEPGKQIRTYLPPAESFKPMNSEAEQVYAAMFQWIGGKTPDIAEQVEEAERNAHLPPMVTGAMQPARGGSHLVEAVDEPLQDVRRKRVAGTIVPERRDVSLGERAAGPTMVGDFAA